MKNFWGKIININISEKKVPVDSTRTKTRASTFVVHDSERKLKIEKGAKDFAIRFEGIMKELSNG